MYMSESRVWNFRRKNNSAVDGIDGIDETIGSDRIPAVPQKRNSRNSIPNYFTEEKNARNFVPWNKKESNSRNTIPNNSAEEKTTRNFVPRNKK
jgi:hypothetical protein